MKERTIVKIKPDDLKTKKGNPRKISRPELGKLCESIREFGYVEIIVADEDNTVIAGHQRLKAMAKLGMDEEIDVLRLTGYTESEKKAIGIALNKIGGEWDKDKLQAWLAELKAEDYNIILTGFDADDLEEYEISLDLDAGDSETGEGGNSELKDEIKAAIRSGDFIVLGKGRHILLCGDSTKPEDVSRLMSDGRNKAALLFTDPPYNINYAEMNRDMRNRGGSHAKDWTGTYCTDTKDNLDPEEYRAFLTAFLQNAKSVLIDHAHYYIWFAFQFYAELTGVLEVIGIPYDKVPIIWKKQTIPISWASYKRVYEPCLFAGKGASNGAGKASRWFGPNNEVNVWEIDADWNGSYIHPTQKPVALAERAIRNSSLTNDIVLDLFGGSGSTLIACERTKRQARIMEKSEIYCHNIIERWCKYTGIDEIEINGVQGKWTEYKAGSYENP